MIKLIVTDFDGTLMPYGEERVSEKVKEYIRTALDKGLLIAVSSGRTYGELIGFLPEFKDELYFICSDGAYCVKGEKTPYFRALERAELALFANAYNTQSATAPSFIFHGAFKNYSLGKVPSEADRFNAQSIDRIDEIKEKIFKVFYNEDMIVHHNSGVSYALGMSSSRIFNYECINNANPNGWYAGDGLHPRADAESQRHRAGRAVR